MENYLKKFAAKPKNNIEDLEELLSILNGFN